MVPRKALCALALLGMFLTSGTLLATDLEDLLWEFQIIPLDGPAPDFSLESLDGKLVGRAAGPRGWMTTPGRAVLTALLAR